MLIFNNNLISLKNKVKELKSLLNRSQIFTQEREYLIKKKVDHDA